MNIWISPWALLLFALAWSIIFKRLVIPFMAFWYLSEAILSETSSEVIGFLFDGATGACYVEILNVVGFGRFGWDGPVGNWISGYLFVFP